MLRYALPATLALGTVVALPSHAAFIAVREYDENIEQTNEVDVNTADAAAFETLVQAAYDAGLGGVIDFDLEDGNPTTPNGDLRFEESFTATYASGTKTMTVSESANYSLTFDNPNNNINGRTAISKTQKLSVTGSTSPAVLLDFDLAGTGDVLQAIGLTILGPNAGSTATFNLFVTYDDATTSSVVTEEVTGGGTDDTFVSFTAPAGRNITRLNIFGASDGQGGFSSPTFASYDDLAFIVVPEPASLALVGLGAAAIFARRRSA